jgi:hypothetical protein
MVISTVIHSLLYRVFLNLNIPNFLIQRKYLNIVQYSVKDSSY